MSTYLRIAGKNLDVDDMLAKVEIAPYRVWRKGEKKNKTADPEVVHAWSGAAFCTSDADMAEFDLQVEESIDFLTQYHSEIRQMLESAHIEEVTIDFAIELRNVTIHSDYIPPLLAQIAGQLGIGIELSHYPGHEDCR